jgi:acyl-[acyl-carrier protein] desaturase
VKNRSGVLNAGRIVPVTESPALRERIYRIYMEFFEVSERKRRWNIFDDVPWDKLDSSRNNERTAAAIETFCAEEFYIPDYAAKGIEVTREVFGAAWFQICWSYEESKHGLVFREYLVRSGLRSPSQMAAFEDEVFSSVWQLPFRTRRAMTCYGALQEAATYLAYKAQKDRAERDGDAVLERIFALVSRDEAAHAGFYRAVLEIEMTADREGTLEDLATVVSQFKMPGDGLIRDYQQRLKTSGAGISTREFLAHGLFPTLRTLGTNRAELREALAKIAVRPPVAASG